MKLGLHCMKYYIHKVQQVVAPFPFPRSLGNLGNQTEVRKGGAAVYTIQMGHRETI